MKKVNDSIGSYSSRKISNRFDNNQYDPEMNWKVIDKPVPLSPSFVEPSADTVIKIPDYLDSKMNNELNDLIMEEDRNIIETDELISDSGAVTIETVDYYTVENTAIEPSEFIIEQYNTNEITYPVIREEVRVPYPPIIQPGHQITIDDYLPDEIVDKVPRFVMNDKNNDDFPTGIEKILKLPFNLVELKRSMCPNLRAGPLYKNYLAATLINVPDPLPKNFQWQGSHIMSGGIIRKGQRYENEKKIYVIHPSEWKHLDSHLKMILLICLRGSDGPFRSRFIWPQIECMTGESQKTLSNLLKESKRTFPIWHASNAPPVMVSKSSFLRAEIRRKFDLPDRSGEWKNKGRLERQYLIYQENQKGHTKINILGAIFDVSSSIIKYNQMKTFKEYINHTFKSRYRINDDQLRSEMVAVIDEDYACPFCPKKLNLSNCKESAIHHCHLCGLIIDVTCRACNALEKRKLTFRSRFIFGFRPQATGAIMRGIPYIYEFGQCVECNKDGRGQ